MTNKPTTLAQLVLEFFSEDESKGFVFCDAGNGSAYGEDGQYVPYDNDAAKTYGPVTMVYTGPHKTVDRLETIYASDWIKGDNGYRYMIRF